MCPTSRAAVLTPPSTPSSRPVTLPNATLPSCLWWFANSPGPRRHPTLRTVGPALSSSNRISLETRRSLRRPGNWTLRMSCSRRRTASTAPRFWPAAQTCSRMVTRAMMAAERMDSREPSRNGRCPSTRRPVRTAFSRRRPARTAFSRRRPPIRLLRRQTLLRYF